MNPGRLLFAYGLVAILTCRAPVPCAANGTDARALQDAARISAGRSPSPIVIEGNRQLFATMCALQAAGFEAEVSAAGFHPLRARLRAELMRQQGPATQALRRFYREHLLTDRATMLSRYVSFALVAGPPPKFNYTLRHDELPPDVLAIEDFNGVLADFYQEAGIEQLWARVAPQYEREVARLQQPVAELVTTATAYLRELMKPTSSRTFAVYVEPMVGGRTNFRNYGDCYVVVLHPASDLPLDEIRHAFLHFLLDPLAVRHRGVVAAKATLLDFAARAPRLPAEHREDFPTFLSECLVRAVELRLRRLSSDGLAAAADAAERDGYVLVRAFLRGLAKFEKAEPAMSFYFPDLVRGINTAEEAKRLQNVTFAPEKVFAEVPGTDATTLTETAEVAAALAEGERQIAAQNAGAAVAAFEQVLAREPDHPRALYGLGVASVLQGEVDRAEEIFQRLVVKPPGADARMRGKDPLIVAWSHVYLGRIHDVGGQRELAMSEYRAALAVEGAPESARLAARRGIEKGYQPASKDQ